MIHNIPAYFKIWLVSTLLLSVSFTGSSQNLETLIREAKPSGVSFEEQLKNLYDLIPVVEKTNYADTLGQLYYFIAYRHYELNQMEPLLSATSASIRYLEEASYQGYRLEFNYFFRAQAYKLLGNDAEAIKDAEFVTTAVKSGRGLEILADAHRLLSSIYRENGEHESAINQLEYFLTTEISNDVDKHAQGSVLLDLSLCYSNYMDSTSIAMAFQSINQSIDLLPEIKNEIQRENLDLAIHMQLGFIHSRIGNELNAIDAYESALDLIDENTISEEQKRFRITIIGNLISLYNDANMFEKLEHMIRKISPERDIIITEDLSTPYSILYENIAEYYVSIQNIKEAKIYIEKAYSAIDLDPDFITDDVLDNEKRNRIARILLVEIILNDTLYSLLHDDIFLMTGLKKMNVLDTIIDHINQNLFFESSILNWRQEAKSFYEKGIDIAYKLDDHESVWLYMEKAKGLALLEAISNDTYIQDRDDVSENREQLKKLQLAHAELVRKQQREAHSFEYENLVEALIKNKKSQKDLLQVRHSIVKKKIPEIVNLSNQLNQLNEESLVQYFIAADQVYAMALHESKSQLYSLGTSWDLLQKIELFRNYLQEENLDGNYYDQLNNVLHDLFDFLIKPLQLSGGHLIVIPDGNLFLVPLDCLLNERDQFLIEKHSIQYELSASLAAILNNSQAVSSSFVLSPNYTESKYDMLEYTEQEAKTVLSYTYKQTDRIFQKPEIINKYTKSDIFHFAGHALVDEGASNSTYLALSDTSSLTEEEIYNYPNILKMAVLSACNTGIGDILQGEGISNLTRSFMYSGTASVVQSLWSINDASSYSIIKEFYEGLRRGETKSKALQAAKINFLHTADDFQKHPYYWSGLVLVGNDVPLSFDKSNSSILIALSILFMVFLLILYHIRNRKN